MKTTKYKHDGSEQRQMHARSIINAIVIMCGIIVIRIALVTIAIKIGINISIVIVIIIITGGRDKAGFASGDSGDECD